MAVAKGRTSSADRTSTLKVGDVAPDFDLKATTSDAPWKLSDQRGKSNVVVAFFPFSFTPV
jgi:peroxiredoxin (alkyl hydroperoxide reductase subunit C)